MVRRRPPSWRGDQHLAGTGLEVGGGLVARSEDAGALQRHIDIAPGQVGGVADAVTGSGRVPTSKLSSSMHGAGKAAVHTVVFQKVRIGLDGAEIVDRDDARSVRRALDDAAQDVAPDAAEPVDREPDGHDILLAVWYWSLVSANITITLTKSTPNPDKRQET